MQDDAAVQKVMIRELEELSAKHAVPRRTSIEPEEGQ